MSIFFIYYLIGIFLRMETFYLAVLYIDKFCNKNKYLCSVQSFFLQCWLVCFSSSKIVNTIQVSTTTVDSINIFLRYCCVQLQFCNQKLMKILQKFGIYFPATVLPRLPKIWYCSKASHDNSKICAVLPSLNTILTKKIYIYMHIKKAKWEFYNSIIFCVVIFKIFSLRQSCSIYLITFLRRKYVYCFLKRK